MTMNKKSLNLFAAACGLLATGACVQLPPVATEGVQVIDGVRLEVRRDAARPVRGKYLVTLNDAASVYEQRPPYRAMLLAVHGDGRIEVVRKFMSHDFAFWATDFRPQPDGRYTFAINRPRPPLWAYEMRVLDPATNTEIVDIKGQPLRDPALDGHESIVYDGDKRLFLYFRRREEGGKGYWDMEVAARSATTGQVVGKWSSKDNFPPERIENHLHFNSLFPLGGDRVLASARTPSTLYVINLASGKVDDKIDSKDWKVIGDPLGGFSRQHFAHFLANGNLLMYDNRDAKESQPHSRAVEYAVDWKARTLTMVWQMKSEASMPFREGWGSASAIGSDEVLVGWGDYPRTKGYCDKQDGNFPVFSHAKRDGSAILELRAPCGWVTYRAYFVPDPAAR